MGKRILLFLLGISVVIGNSFSFFSIGPLSFYPLRIMIVLSFVYILLFRRNIKINFKRESITFIFFGSLIIKSLISLISTNDIINSLTTFSMYLSALSIVVILLFLITKYKDLHVLLIGYSIGVFVVCLIGIYEIFTGDYLIYNTNYDYMSSTHTNLFNLSFPLVQFHNINNLATFLTLSIPLIGMLDTKNNKTLKIFKRLLLILIVFNIIMGESRGAIVSLILIAFLLGLNYLKNKNIQRSHIYIMLFLVFIIFFPIFLNKILDSNFILESRIIIWENVFTELQDTFFLGVGVGNTGKSSLNLNSALLQSFSAHNYLLEVFSDFGLFIFLLMSLWLLNIFHNSKYITSNIYSEIFLILFLIMSIVPSTMVGMDFIWLGFGIIICYTGLSKNKLLADN